MFLIRKFKYIFKQVININCKKIFQLSDVNRINHKENNINSYRMDMNNIIIILFIMKQ